mmetsp:Transcript_4272/g.13359  ORF Transcript_4272/g.13359 Transcript_4272/m.13359 type:complete len:201 (-) Transcript_4272:197-799(-)
MVRVVARGEVQAHAAAVVRGRPVRQPDVGVSFDECEVALEADFVDSRTLGTACRAVVKDALVGVVVREALDLFDRRGRGRERSAGSQRRVKRRSRGREFFLQDRDLLDEVARAAGHRAGLGRRDAVEGRPEAAHLLGLDPRTRVALPALCAPRLAVATRGSLAGREAAAVGVPRNVDGGVPRNVVDGRATRIAVVVRPVR